MIDTVFNGEKTLLIGTEDLFKENEKNTIYKVTRARVEGYGLILIITSLPITAIPLQIRLMIHNKNTDVMRCLRIHV